MGAQWRSKIAPNAGGSANDAWIVSASLEVSGDVMPVLGRTGMIGSSVALDHPVDEPVLDCLRRLEEPVALHVGVDLLLALAGVERVDLIGPLADLQDL